MNIFYRYYIPMILFGYPIVSTVPILIDVQSRIITIPYRFLILLISVFIIFKFWKHLRIKKIKFFLFFWGAYFIRLLWDFEFNQENLRLELYEYISYSIMMCMIPALAFGLLMIFGEKDEKLQTRIIFLGLIGILLNLILLLADNSFDFNALFKERMQTRTLNSVSLSSLGFSFALLCSIFLIRKKNYLLSISLISIGILFGISGGSRGPAIAFLVAYTICFFKFTFIKSNKFFEMQTVIILLMVLLVILFVDFYNIPIISRLVISDASDDIRFSLFSSGLSLYIDNIILGSGIEPLGFYPHNIVLEAFLVFGVFTGIPFLILIINALIKSFVLFYKNINYFWIVPLFIYNLIINMVNGSLYQDYIFWSIICFFMLAGNFYKKHL